MPENDWQVRGAPPGALGRPADQLDARAEEGMAASEDDASGRASTTIRPTTTSKAVCA